MKDRRKFFRAPLSLAVKYRDDENKEIEAFTATISGGGIFIETFRPLPIDNDIFIEIHLPGSKDKTVLEGKIVWSRKGYANEYPPGMGVKFTKISRQDQARINELVTRVLVGGAEEGI